MVVPDPVTDLLDAMDQIRVDALTRGRSSGDGPKPFEGFVGRRCQVACKRGSSHRHCRIDEGLAFGWSSHDARLPNT